MVRLALAGTLAAVFCAPLWAQTGGTAHLSGRAIDGGGTPLVGVTITLTGNGVNATAITDANGRYDLDAFVIGSVDYTLTAFLAGFETTTRTRLRVVPGVRRAPEDIVVRHGCVDQDVLVIRSIQAAARGADLVAHVRVESVAAVSTWRGKYGCLTAPEVTASVEADAAGGVRRRMRFLTRPRVPIDPGDEYVAAFHWDPEAQRHIAWILQVRAANGVATLDNLSVSEGLERQMGVDELLRRLR
jgi:hypothetical protein